MTLLRSSDYSWQIALLESIAFTAVEHEASFDLLSLANYLDLYARHLESASREEGPVCLPFEAFAEDADALVAAARSAERHSGIPTSAPSPLGAVQSISS